MEYLFSVFFALFRERNVNMLSLQKKFHCGNIFMWRVPISPASCALKQKSHPCYKNQPVERSHRRLNRYDADKGVCYVPGIGKLQNG